MNEKPKWPEGETVTIGEIYYMGRKPWELVGADTDKNEVHLMRVTCHFYGTYQDFKENFTLLP